MAVWTGAEQAAFQAVLDGFTQQNPDVKVNYTAAGDQLPTQLSTAVQGGNPPDIAALPQPGLMTDFVKKGALQPLDFAASERRAGRYMLIVLAPSEAQVDAGLRARVEGEAGMPPGTYDWRLPSRVVMRLRDAIDATIPLVDLTPVFACHAALGERLYHPLNTHWSAEGNQLAAQQIAAAIERTWFGAPGSDGAACADSPPPGPPVDAGAIDEYVRSILASKR